jgi:hypothetical protein
MSNVFDRFIALFIFTKTWRHRFHILKIINSYTYIILTLEQFLHFLNKREPTSM